MVKFSITWVRFNIVCPTLECYIAHYLTHFRVLFNMCPVEKPKFSLLWSTPYISGTTLHPCVPYQSFTCVHRIKCNTLNLQCLRLNYVTIHRLCKLIKWGTPSWWSKSLYRRKRNWGQVTIGKTHFTLLFGLDANQLILSSVECLICPISRILS